MASLVQLLEGSGVLAVAETGEERHQPVRLVQHPALLRQGRVPRDEGDDLLRDPLVLRGLEMEQLDRAAREVEFERVLNLGEPSQNAVDLYPFRELPREVVGPFPSARVGVREPKWSARARSIS